METPETEKYRIVTDPEKSRATIFVNYDGRKISLADALRSLSEFRKVEILYEPPLLLDL